MSNHFACYEREWSNQWQLVVYHGGKPTQMSGRELLRSPYFEVPPEMLHDADTPNFQAIRKAFPNPMQPEEIEE